VYSTRLSRGEIIEAVNATEEKGFKDANGLNLKLRSTRENRLIQLFSNEYKIIK